MPDTSGMIVVPMFVHVGRYPLYDVEARMVDLDEHARLTAASDPSAINALVGATLRVGNMTPGFSRGPLPALQHPSGQRISYNVFFVARNGAWVQQFRMRWVDNGWAVANKVHGLGRYRACSVDFVPV